MTKRRGNINFGGPGGAQGGGMNPKDMLKQYEKMQEDMLKAREALEQEVIDVSGAGGAITVQISGHQRVKGITINPELVDTTDPEWLTDLQDLLTAVVNQAIEESQRRSAERMDAVSSPLMGMLPGGLGGLLGGME
jgi:hypothetical protein